MELGSQLVDTVHDWMGRVHGGMYRDTPAKVSNLVWFMVKQYTIDPVKQGMVDVRRSIVFICQ